MEQLRQERAEKRYKPGMMKSRAAALDWDAMPEWSLLPIRDVCFLTGLSVSALNERLKEGKFPMYVRHGKDRIWQLGAIRSWCKAVARGEIKEAFRPAPTKFRDYYAGQAEEGSDNG
jgi:predicted DNA-binding transcriptional regulator AlpA